jgi:hypothetical protein
MEFPAKILKQIKTWLTNKRRRLFSWYNQNSQETEAPERSLVELPPDIRKQLVEAIDNLPTNPTDRETIISKLDETFDRWRDDIDHADNSVVVLSSPVTAVSRILSEALDDWAKTKQIPIRLLPFTIRPIDIDTIKSKLEHYLEPQPTSNNCSESQNLEIVVIPNLSWCFLRSYEGLEGIEYLQSLFCDDTNHRFWIIGMGWVGWEYLNLIFDLQANCGEIVTLPEIAAAELQAWLEPIVQDLEITFEEPNIDKQLLDRDKDNKTHYFERLSSISNGVSSIAAQVFLQSICDEEAPEEAEAQSHVLVAQNPKLPKLDDLVIADQYLLHCLMLHGDITISALVASLGDSKPEVKARVKTLMRRGIIEQKAQVLSINPIYYPKLKQQLASNNFIVKKRR